MKKFVKRKIMNKLAIVIVSALLLLGGVALYRIQEDGVLPCPGVSEEIEAQAKRFEITHQEITPGVGQRVYILHDSTGGDDFLVINGVGITKM